MEYISKRVAARLITVFLLAITAAVFFVNIAFSSSFFSDVPASSLYSPHIESLYSAHFITGDTVMGIPSGTFRPDDTINRAEFTKITSIIRLAELYGIKEKWNGKPELEILESVNDKLRYFYRCDNTDTPECSIKKGADITNVCNVCSSIGGTPFSDVTEKEWGCEEEGICDPWFTQYIYYAVAKGFIKGFPDKTFKPYNPIIRIHALKMILSDNGTTDDARFQSLESLADSRGSSSPRCLFGADKYILDNNDGDTDLLSFALLSDRLGLFGNDCSVFGSSTTPKQRADFLQRSLTRKEAARYYALTTSYYPISADPGSAPKEDTVVKVDEEVKTVTETTVKTGTKAPVAKTPTTVPTQKTETTDSTFSDATVSSSSTISLTDENGRSCGTIPADTEFGLFAARKGTNGKFYQYVDYKDLINCRFLCDTLMTPECREAIALNGGIIEERFEIADSKSSGNSSWGGILNNIGNSITTTSERANTIINNMDKARYADGLTDLETCVWASRDSNGNKKPYSEYLIVMGWCKQHGVTEKDIENKIKKNGEEAEAEDFKIDKSYSVSIKKDAKTTLFNHFEFKKSGSAQSNKSNGKPLYIFVHGWGGNPSIWAESMSKLIPGDPQILFVDWSKVVERDNTEVAPYYEATWVDAVADKAAEALKEWGINNSNTTIIGHSLGTILGGKLAVKIEGVSSTSGIKNVKMIMLDPAAYAWEYRTDMQGTTFSSFGNNGLCIVADDSIPGSETLMNTCKEKYLIEYDDPMNNSEIDDYVDFTVDEIKDANILTTAYKIIKGSISGFFAKKIATNTAKYIYNEAKESITNHLWVYSTYKEIIRNPFYNNILHPDNALSSDSYYKLQNGKINGVIYTKKDQPEEIKYLKTIQDKPGLDDKYSMFGNNRSNVFECDESMGCIMYTSGGNDEINQTEYTKSVYVTDFDEKNDKIMFDMHGMNYFIKMPNVTDESWYQSGVANIGIIPISGRQVALGGVTFDKIEGWVKAAQNNLRSEDQVATPILINK